MLKAKGPFRGEMPRWVLGLRDHMLAANFSGPIFNEGGEVSCALCTVALDASLRHHLDAKLTVISQDVEVDGHLSYPSYVCAGCTVKWHKPCAEFLS